MEETLHLVVFELDASRFALPLGDVDRVLRAVDVTPLPEAPANVIGLVNLQGRLIPAINLRMRCRLPQRPVDSSDQFVIAHTPRRTVALVVDKARVAQYPARAAVPANEVVATADFVRTVVKDSAGMILVCDLNALLSPRDETALAGAMSGTGAGA